MLVGEGEWLDARWCFFGDGPFVGRSDGVGLRHFFVVLWWSVGMLALFDPDSPVQSGILDKIFNGSAASSASGVVVSDFVGGGEVELKVLVGVGSIGFGRRDPRAPWGVKWVFVLPSTFMACPYRSL